MADPSPQFREVEADETIRLMFSYLEEACDLQRAASALEFRASEEARHDPQRAMFLKLASQQTHKLSWEVLENGIMEYRHLKEEDKPK